MKATKNGEKEMIFTLIQELFITFAWTALAI
jgi:hypothetical protein